MAIHSKAVRKASVLQKCPSIYPQIHPRQPRPTQYPNGLYRNERRSAARLSLQPSRTWHDRVRDLILTITIALTMPRNRPPLYQYRLYRQRQVSQLRYPGSINQVLRPLYERHSPPKSVALQAVTIQTRQYHHSKLLDL